MCWYTAVFWLTTLRCCLDYILLRRSLLYLKPVYKRQAAGSSKTLMTTYMWQHVVERHAALRHAATSPNLYNDVILPSVLT